jgi:hypothetical protein
MIHGLPNMRAYGWEGLKTPSPIQGGPNYPKTASSRFTTLLDRVMDRCNIKFAYDMDYDRAVNYSGRTYVPELQVDEWGRVVQQDPFIPDATKALLIAAPQAASMSAGSKWVTPADVAQVTLNAGLGYAIGNVIGRVAGPLLRLTPQAQRDLQQAGMLAGVFKTIGLM